MSAVSTRTGYLEVGLLESLETPLNVIDYRSSWRIRYLGLIGLLGQTLTPLALRARHCERLVSVRGILRAVRGFLRSLTVAVPFEHAAVAGSMRPWRVARVDATIA